ncbi:hypothetical protein [Vibrio parahaemolyticus]|nr:hypothetical protein [Vibrio parahaemolyticus]MDI7850200.1 hypothetical protein [Vibrio parahaemolyticus]MDZ5209550.1 hypothetical protein [Vibrio parahaemolyticus]
MKRVYIFSKGNMRLIRRLINKAAKFALLENAPCISLKHFARAAPKVSRDACKSFNPFDTDTKKLKIIEPPEDVGWENYLAAKGD